MDESGNVFKEDLVCRISPSFNVCHPLDLAREVQIREFMLLVKKSGIYLNFLKPNRDTLHIYILNMLTVSN